MSSLKFGDFAWICSRSSLPLCAALGLGDPLCYSRNVGLYDFLLYQPSVFAIDFCAIIMTIIMIAHIKSKYTAVGRKEMVIFFYLYLSSVIFELLLVTQIIPLSPLFYKYAAAAQIGLITSAFGTLLLNGFIGFQWTEDGTKTSVWTFRFGAASFFIVGLITALGTFLGLFGMSPGKPLILFVLLFIFNGAAALLYIALQIFLIFYALHDMWPLGMRDLCTYDQDTYILLGDLFFGSVFFSLGMLAMLGFSNQICRFAIHYVDGMFLGSTFILLSVMMVYKYWDSITSEDLEFSIPGGPQLWHIHNTMDIPVIKGQMEQSTVA